MTPQDILDAFDDYGFDTEPGIPRKLSIINNTIADIASRNAWPFLETTIDLNFDGTNPYPSNWPTDFRQAMVVVRTDNGAPLEWTRTDVFYKLHGNEITSAGDPQLYYFVGKQLRVWQVPSAATGLLHMPYIRTHPTVLQTDPESAILIPPQHHEAILFGSLYKLYDMQDDFDLSARFQSQYEQRMQTMESELIIVQYDRPDRVYDIDIDLYDL